MPDTNFSQQRTNMINNVQHFWVEGVLERSLHGATLIELGMQEDEAAVRQPWDITIRTGEDEVVTLAPGTNIEDVFTQLDGQMLILGEPGSGKTITLLQLTRELLKLARNDPNHPIPVVVNLSSWVEAQKTLEEWLIGELYTKYHIPQDAAQRWIDMDSLILQLDGLDEVHIQLRPACVETINVYRQKHPNTQLVICSRIFEYDMLSVHLRLNGAMVLQPLGDAQVENYLASFGPETQRIRDLIKQHIPLHEISRSPLFVSILAMIHPRITDIEDMDKRQLYNYLFAEYVAHMFETRNKGVSIEKSRHYLAWLGSLMVWRNQTVFLKEAVESSWLFKSRQVTIFTGLLMFLTGIIGIVLIGGLIASTLYLASSSSDVQYLIITLVCGGIGLGIPITWYTADYIMNRPVELGRRSNDMTGEFLKTSSRIGLFLGILVAIGLIIGKNPLAAVYAFIAFPLVFMLMSIVIVKLRRPLLYLTLYLTGDTPANFAGFLDHAVHLTFLRKVGTGYIFIHRSLLEYFASLKQVDDHADEVERIRMTMRY